MEILGCENVVYEINKSKFVGFAYCVNSLEEINNKLVALAKLHNKATHICYAYILSNPNLEKCSDDGEPEGTAGRPILELLKRNNLSNTLIVVVRYFGGIKLGVGGLLRAYSTCAKNTLDLCEFVEYENAMKYVVNCEIVDKIRLCNLAKSFNATILTQNYTDKFEICIELSVGKADEFENQIKICGFNIIKSETVKKRK